MSKTWYVYNITLRNLCKIKSLILIIDMLKQLFFMLILLSVISCKENEKTDFLNHKINFDGVENISEKRLNDAGYDKSISYSVVVYWDSITCSSCVLDELYIWKEHYDELKSLNMDVLFIFNADDIKKIPRDLCSLCDIIKVKVDKVNTFYTNNTFLTNRNFHISVINQANEIVWFGSPLRSEKTWKKFKEYISYLS